MAGFMIITFFASVVALFFAKRKYKDLRLTYLRNQKNIHLSEFQGSKKP